MNRVRSCCLLVAALQILLVCGPVSAAQSSAARKAYEAATAAFGLGHYADAAEKYEKAFSLHPDPALLYNAAQAFRLAGNSKRALELYRNYLRLYPDGSNADEARVQVSALGKVVEGEAPPASASPPASPPPSAPLAPAPVAPIAAAPTPGPAPAPPLFAAPPLVSSPDATVVATASPAEPAPSHTWIWIAVGAAAVVGGTIAVLLATRSDSFPDPSFGKATGN
jgi:tetratricopeptide (TPR) repeat protein